MLATLDTTRIVIVMRSERPAVPPLPMVARWLGRRPRRAGSTTRITLAKGVWVLRDADAAPMPRFSPPDWMARGLCTQLPPEISDSLFFGLELRESPGALIAAADSAREICAQCPVAAICLTNALTGDERYGVWGGTSGRQREKLRTRLAAGAAVQDLVDEAFPGPPAPATVALAMGA